MYRFVQYGPSVALRCVKVEDGQVVSIGDADFSAESPQELAAMLADALAQSLCHPVLDSREVPHAPF